VFKIPQAVKGSLQQNLNSQILNLKSSLGSDAFYDQLGNKIILQASPNKIISLVPSQTELLFDLGLDEQIVGITKFCIHPAKAFKEKTIIGGTKKFDFDVIDRLTPDLIIGNKEENYKEGIDLLKEKYPVWMSDIVTLEDSFVNDQRHWSGLW
jgi:ABC-type Fe3+-hydroxamate transport system substrate-binding protein